MFAREGYPLLLGMTALAVLAFATALRFRSWPVWLLAFALTVGAIYTAWYSRNASVALLAELPRA